MADPISCTCVAGLATACAGSFMAECSKEVYQRLKTCLTDLFPCFRSNIGQTDADKSPGGQIHIGQILGGQFNFGQIAGDQTNAMQIFRGPMYTEQSLGGQICTEPTIEYPAGQILGAQMNGSLMILARSLQLMNSQNKCWEWVHDSGETRFKEVAVLPNGLWCLEIKALIEFDLLSATKTYSGSVYLIFKITPDSEGLDAVQIASVSVGKDKQMKCVCLKPTKAMARNIELPVQRLDGWMELELGHLLCNNITGNQVAEVSIKETDYYNKRGLIVAGIEVRYRFY